MHHVVTSRHLVYAIVVSLGSIACESGTGPAARLPEFHIATTTVNHTWVSLFDENGTRLNQLSCGSGCQVYDPRLAPDGGMLAMTAIKDFYSILYVADMSGNLRELARSESYLQGSIQGTTRRIYPQYQQVWSRSGRLAYVQDDTILVATARYGQDPRIILVKSAGLSGIDWVPGDTAISFVSQNAVYVATLSSGAVSSISGLQGFSRSPLWAPDGSAFAIKREESNRTTLYRYDIRTHAMLPLGTFDAVGGLCWSSDSKAVAFIGQDFPITARSYVSFLDGRPPALIKTESNSYILGWWAESKTLAALEAAGVAVYDTDSWKRLAVVPLEANVSSVDVAGGRCSEQFYLLPDS